MQRFICVYDVNNYHSDFKKLLVKQTWAARVVQEEWVYPLPNTTVTGRFTDLARATASFDAAVKELNKADFVVERLAIIPVSGTNWELRAIDKEPKKKA